jgi:hypothetical protein
MLKKLLFTISLFLFINCSSKEEELYLPITYNLEIPSLFSQKLIAPVIPANNPLTQEGVALGKNYFQATIHNLVHLVTILKMHFQIPINLAMELTERKESEMRCLCSI